MAEGKHEARELTVRTSLSWLELFRGFQIAIDPRKLLLAAAGILAMGLGWWVLSAIFNADEPNWEKYKAKDKDWADYKSDLADWDLKHKELTFAREGEGALVTPAVSQIGTLAVAAEAKDGKTADAPAEVLVAERKLRAAQPSAGPASAPQGRKKLDR